MPGVPTLALTATATGKVQKDIIRLLKIKACKQFQACARSPAWPSASHAQSAACTGLVPAAPAGGQAGPDLCACAVLLGHQRLC